MSKPNAHSHTMKKAVFKKIVIKLYIRVPMGTNCALLVADLILVSYERTLKCIFLMINRLILLTPKYLDIVLNINDNMVSQIYHSELQLK